MNFGSKNFYQSIKSERDGSVISSKRLNTSRSREERKQVEDKTSQGKLAMPATITYTAVHRDSLAATALHNQRDTGVHEQEALPCHVGVAITI